MNRTLGHRLLALACAYALGLGAFLPILAFLGLPGADAAPAIICGPGGDGSMPAAPQQPHPCCPAGGVCAMSGCAATAVPERPPGAALPAWVSIGLVLLPPDVRPRAPSPVSASLARGPPPG